ncbi:pantoate--beta-alanine ligase [Streptomyces sp. XD-27]|uniref:pantoate--beta-alanine ligase n=1 Tax=Streptomyces sp. XD-27 TaxID=3062779 RepID=UPI0026F42271|nr:pantoate--beta-alanine ligase [Streptomyces sp. XD-27]WKX71804.1 pantoate--beta-alanine ligase [Streptomyces sp. XD-27]
MSPKLWNAARPGEPDVELYTRRADLDRALTRFAAPPGRTAVVMTMGALHEGHASLIRAARERVGAKGLVTATVFVNPLQFGAGEDLDRYPRTLDADLAVAAEAGADIVFAPSVDEVYPGGGEPRVRMSAGPMGERYEGAFRPGHFDGMLTVVAKLLHLTRPDLAFFGEKDAQQLALIRRMARDLDFPVEIVGVPTVRESDGLALSSRNRYLSGPERATALSLSRALFAGREAGRLAARGAGAGPYTDPDLDPNADAFVAPADAVPVASPDAVRAAAHAVLAEAAHAEPPLVLDYLGLVDPADFTEVPGTYAGEAVLAVAAKVGATRLIDNIRLDFRGTGTETGRRAGTETGRGTALREADAMRAAGPDGADALPETTTEARSAR